MLSGNGGLNLATGRLRSDDLRALSRGRTETLIAAVRDDEARTAPRPLGRRAHDLSLHTRVAELLGGSGNPAR